MKPLSVYTCTISIFVVAFILQDCGPALSPAEIQIKRAAWRTQQVAPGVQWSYHHFKSVFDAPQSVTVFEIDPDQVTTVVEHLDSGFFLTSTGGREAGAVVAINGSFFNTKRGGSVVFFQKDGEMVTPSGDALRAYRDNAGFAIDRSGNVAIIKKPGDGWKISTQYATILSSGPMLLTDGDLVDQVQQPFNINRHPRTAIGLTKHNHGRPGRHFRVRRESSRWQARAMDHFMCSVALSRIHDVGGLPLQSEEGMGDAEGFAGSCSRGSVTHIQRRPVALADIRRRRWTVGIPCDGAERGSSGLQFVRYCL